MVDLDLQCLQTHVVQNMIKNSLSFCFSLSLSFPYLLPAELRIVLLEVWRFIIQQVNNNATSPHHWIKNWLFSHKKSAELWIGSICTWKCSRIKNCQTSKCCRFVIRQITQTQTETEAVRSHYKIRNYTTLLFMVDLLTVHPSNQFTVASTEKIENLDVHFSMWRKYS